MPLPRRTAVRLLAGTLAVWLVVLLALHLTARDGDGWEVHDLFWFLPERLGYWIYWLMVETGLKEYPTH